MGLAIGAEIAAVGATVLATVGAVPQLRRLCVTRDAGGVSSSAAGLGVATEVTWVGYMVTGEMWAAVPEACLMLASNVVLLLVLARAGVDIRRAAAAGVVWLGVLGGVAALGGRGAVAVVLAVAYAVQVTPAVWSVYRTALPTGVAPATWAMSGVEALLWGVYGVGHGDPANICFSIVGLLAAGAILARTVAPARPRCPGARPDRLHGDRAARLVPPP